MPKHFAGQHFYTSAALGSVIFVSDPNKREREKKKMIVVLIVKPRLASLAGKNSLTSFATLVIKTD